MDNGPGVPLSGGERVRLVMPGDQPLEGLAHPPGGVALVVFGFGLHDGSNAVSRAFLAELDGVLDAAAGDSRIRVLVLAGPSGGAFATGPDSGETEGMDAMDATAYALRGQEVTHRLETIPLPVIAAVGGACLDAGLELALACDLRVASERATFGLSWCRRGLTPAFGGIRRLLSLAGPAAAKEMCFSGEDVEARRAYRMGFVERLVPCGEEVTVALEIASRWAQCPPAVLAAVKETIVRVGHLPPVEALRCEAAAFGRLFSGEA